MALPPLPKIAFSEEEDLSPQQASGWMKLRRRRMHMVFGSGDRSDAFVLDSVERKALDAVVVAAHHMQDGVRHVWLRSSVRPAIGMRPEALRPFPEKDTLGTLWEVVAGLVEPDEISVAGLARCAARELEEELGFAIDSSRFNALGPSNFPACGIIAERLHYFEVEVDPASRSEPPLDGSVLERYALIETIPLAEALEHVRSGIIEDAKTEIALRRLAEIN